MKKIREEREMTQALYRGAVHLRMERQGLTGQLDRAAYDALLRDSQPAQNLYWHGFGQPPVLSRRASFDDLAYNRERQLQRRLVKGRFQGGTLGWVLEEDLECFAGMSRRPISVMDERQAMIYGAICMLGPLNIQQLKEETGLLVKEITPVLHRLQEAFLLYEDQPDGEWDRPWCRFEEMFPQVNPARYTRQEALGTLLLRYAARMVYFTEKMAKDFYRVTGKEIRAAVQALCDEGALMRVGGGCMRPQDEQQALAAADAPLTGVCAGVVVMHRNDMLVKSFEHAWKAVYGDYAKAAAQRFPEAAGFEILQLLIMDGEIHGATLGKFKYGPYIIEDIAVDAGYAGRKDEILAAVMEENPGSDIVRFAGQRL